MKHALALCALLGALSSFASAATTPAFPFTYYIHDTTGVAADTPLTSIYQFASTAVGSNSHIVLKVVNTSNTTAFLGTAFVSTSANSTSANTNYTVTGLAVQSIMPVGGSLIFTLNFSPTAAGLITGFLQTTYQIQQSGCSFTSTNQATQCPSGVNVTATLNGTATQPQLVLSYKDSTGASVVLQPSATPLNFGNVSTSGTAVITFTLTNQSTVTIPVPTITVPPPTVYTSSPFAVNTSALPASLDPQQSANFTITFAPGQTGLATATLNVGTNSFPIQGAGVIIASIDALQIVYVDSTGVRSQPQAASPIVFGQIISGAGAAQAFTFTVTNPSTSFNAVTIPSVAVTGAGFALSAATPYPASVAPGASVTFKVTFTPPATGAYTGTLSIGSRIFSLSGTGITSPLPSFTLVVNPSPLTSQQQATVAVQFASPSTLNLTGQISMTFSPSVTGVSDDPAVKFMVDGSRMLQITASQGGQYAAYDSQSAIAFQTGTTAGTITFTVTFPNTTAFTQSFTITPALIHLSTSTAVRSNPNLIVTLAGYDNTYSAGQLSFTFYDTSGNIISPVTINAASNFQNLFFNGNKAGGAFSLQATFPVTGDVTKVGSVGVTLANSVGQTSTSLQFQ